MSEGFADLAEERREPLQAERFNPLALDLLAFAR